ncbi:MAG TPA: hypothetical protein VM940_07765 [Chthoniobacterales bacterium]|nr:hypothetical protein [Chthoniobacterales bacterium]
MATAKAFASDGVLPFLPKSPRSLGAPFRANWNDHLTVEEPIFAGFGLLVRCFGLGLGANLALLAAHLAAATGFYGAARARAIDPLFAFVFGLLFAMATFAIARNLTHLILTYYWHVPLGLLVIWWCLNEKAWTRQRIVVASCIAAVHGLQNPYFTNMFIQLLGLAALVAVIQGRGTKATWIPVSLGIVAFAFFTLTNLDTLIYRLSHGPNPLVTARNYAGIELYALKPIDLVLPYVHRLQFLETWTQAHYFSKALLPGERGSPYLGWAGSLGLIWMGCSTARAIAVRRFDDVPGHTWMVLWILFYSVVGGLNGMVGTSGMVLFRATNRYSIVILALAFLFLAGKIGSKTRGWRRANRIGVCVAIALIGLWDQVPDLRKYPVMSDHRELLAADREFGAAMQSALPAGTMIFQLPVMEYPESGPIELMGDYEHFRPYLHTQSLRYSYGSDKGRPRERWQREVAELDPFRMIDALERYGFGAILVNKKGYPSSAAQLIAGLGRAGRQTLVAESADFFCVRLTPAADALLPPEFDSHWFGLEASNGSTWRWCDASSTIFLHNGEGARSVHISFGLQSSGTRRIVIRGPSEVLFDKKFGQDTGIQRVDLQVALPPGGIKLSFETDRPGDTPENGDPRKLAFNIRDWKVVQ